MSSSVAIQEDLRVHEDHQGSELLEGNQALIPLLQTFTTTQYQTRYLKSHATTQRKTKTRKIENEKKRTKNTGLLSRFGVNKPTSPRTPSDQGRSICTNLQANTTNPITTLHQEHLRRKLTITQEFGFSRESHSMPFSYNEFSIDLITL